MGKPAARMGDMTAHGGTIAVGIPTVLIGGMPAARVGDFHVCPMLNPGTPPPPHVGGPISMGSTGVFIAGMPAARMGDMATCAGPPDTIAAGCPTVLIGEAGGGGGGGGGAGGSGSGGGSGGAVAASEMAVAVATYEAEPPERPEIECHWIEFQCVDKAGLPVGGVSFEYAGTDGKKDVGVLPANGKVRRDRIKPGSASLKLLTVSNAQWSAPEARTGESVKLTADVDGFEPGVAARITIFDRDLEGGDHEIAVIETVVNGKKIDSEWAYQYPDEDERGRGSGEAGYSHPVYFFVAEVGPCKAVSGLLFYKDWIELDLRDDRDRSIADAAYRIYLSNGEVRTGRLDKKGYARVENVPPGPYRVVLEDYPDVFIESGE